MVIEIQESWSAAYFLNGKNALALAKRAQIHTPLSAPNPRSGFISAPDAEVDGPVERRIPLNRRHGASADWFSTSHLDAPPTLSPRNVLEGWGRWVCSNRCRLH